MIGRIAGRVEHRGADHVLVDVGGVGYVVHVSSRTLAELPPRGEAAALWTELVVREDLLQLIGYRTLQEVEWHRLLVTVQGVGARAAMAILGALGPEGLGRAIALGDWSAVKAAPGVGPKIAQRVVNELKGKGPALADALPDAGPAPAGGGTAEAVSALVNLGYAAAEAQRAVAEAGRDGAEDTPTLIRGALKRLAPA
ncbi:Holliday junction branch migration protein RuvA [Roseitranquillus sediminis]|uniref:Holliday junction branch migration protein RuvA n=1 Tax=Roseitranquillus sediminis TaxID=2809051 RepID=UPI001D0C38FA|nr:Holliday junction branch migration protein RuvA [Roseitranquillus sediminis]MBM9596402.1 Holliday junction branch migration protein RuvA [Roseitranquillus sediminis]